MSLIFIENKILSLLLLGLMYWTDWGQKPCIRRATVDGHNAKAIVEKNLGWPNGLCVDMEASKIYWADARTDRLVLITGLNKYRTCT